MDRGTDDPIRVFGQEAEPLFRDGNDIDSRAQPPQIQADRFLGPAGVHVIRNDHQHVKIAVRAHLAAGRRAEQDDPRRMHCLDNPPHKNVQHGLIRKLQRDHPAPPDIVSTRTAPANHDVAARPLHRPRHERLPRKPRHVERHARIGRRQHLIAGPRCRNHGTARRSPSIRVTAGAVAGRGKPTRAGERGRLRKPETPQLAGVSPQANPAGHAPYVAAFSCRSPCTRTPRSGKRRSRPGHCAVRESV
jgi:hypothetical protein